MKCEGPTTLKDWVATIQGVCTVLGVGAALVLFVLYNESAPRLIITQEARLLLVESGLKEVSLDVQLENPGRATVRRVGGKIIVRKVLPLDPDQINRAEQTSDPYAESDFGKFHADDISGEITWPEAIRPIQFEDVLLKSGEKEARHFEFCVPRNITLLQIDVNLPGDNAESAWRDVKNILLPESTMPANDKT